MAELSSNRTGGNGLQVSTENENLLSCSHALHKTLNLGISRCCFAEDGDEMYQNLYTALFSSLSLSFLLTFSLPSVSCLRKVPYMMKSVVKIIALEISKKKLSNHTTRKTVVKKLRAASVGRQSIIHLTGHASEKSLNDYDEGSEKEQRQLSNIIGVTPQSAASSSFPGLPMWSSPATSSTCEHVKTSGHAFTVNNFHNCQVTFNVIQGQCSSPKSANQNVIP